MTLRYYRFVGGTWANRHVRCDGRPCWSVIVNPELPVKLASLSTLTIEAPCYTQEHYFRYDFVSEGGARFSQYIHQSLIRGGQPDRETYADDRVFPEMPIGDQWRFLYRLTRTKLFPGSKPFYP